MTAEELIAKLGTEQKTHISHGGGTMEYCFKIVGKRPANGKYPVCMLLHGAGERGNGSNNGIQLIHGATDILAYAESEMEGMIFIAPQCPVEKMWIKAPWNLTEHTMEENPTKELALALEILEKEINENDGDRDRIYITGISMGSFGSWDAISRMKDYFASALVCCGGGDVKQAPKLVDLPIYIFHGGIDSVVLPSRSRDMYNAICAAGGKKVEYTEYEGVNHNSWTQTYANKEVLRKFFSHTK